MQVHKNQIIVGVVLATVFLVVCVALLRPSKPVVVSVPPGSGSSVSHPEKRSADGVASPGGRDSQTASSNRLTAEGEETAGKKAGTVPEAPSNTSPSPGSKPVAKETTATLVGAGGGTAGPVGMANHGAKGKAGTAASGSTGGTSSKRNSASGTGSDATGGAGTAEADKTPAPGQALVGGHVVRGDQPVQGALLVLEGGTGVLQTATNADGQYQFPPIAAGNYRIRLVQPAAPQSVREVAVAADARLLGEDFSIPLGPAVRGTIVGYGTDTGVSGARITIYQGTQYETALTSGQGGAFETPPLNPGGYSFEIKAGGYQTKQESVTVPEADTSGVYPLPSPIVLDPANVVQGRVVDTGGAPVGGAQVALFAVGSSGFTGPLREQVPSVFTDTTGSYRITSLPPFEGSFQVGVYKAGYAPSFSPPMQLADVTQGDVPPIQLGPGVAITGQIVDKDGNGLDKVTIGVKRENGFAQTRPILNRFNIPFVSTESGSDGMFRLAGLESGLNEVDFACPDYISQHKSVNATPPEISVGKIEMASNQEAQSGSIFGQVMDENGKPYGNASCNLSGIIGGTRQSYNFSILPGMDGSFNFKNLDSGTYVLNVTGQITMNGVYIVPSQTIGGLQPGQGSVPVIFDLGGAVRIKVVDGAGNPITQFRVDVNSELNWPGAPAGAPNRMTEEYKTSFQKQDGVVDVVYLIPQSVASITVTVDNLGVEKVTGIQVPPAGQIGEPVQIQVGQGGKIEGRVLDEFNSGISAVKVSAKCGANPAVDQITDSDGHFLFGTLSPGTAQLTVSGGDWVQKTISGITVTQGQTTEVPPITLQQGGTLTGIVYQPGTDQPAGGVAVKCGISFASTDTAGRYTLRGVPPGDQKLVVGYEGAPIYKVLDVTVVGGQTQVVNVP